MSSSQTLLINVVKRPFKSGGKLYPAGEIIDDPAGIKLFRTKVREGKIIEVDEHNLLDAINYLKHRRGVNVSETLTNAVKGKPKVDPEYKAKVLNAAAKYGIDTDDKGFEEVVTEVREAQAKAKAEAKAKANDK